MNEIKKIINNTNDYFELKDIIEQCKKRQETLMKESWEQCYKNKSKKHYIPLNTDVNGILYEIYFFNLEDEDIDEKYERLTEYVMSNHPRLSEIISECGYLELNIPKKVQDMICEVCVCGGCPYQEECHGWTCERCKKKGMQGYSWECEE